MLEPIYKESSDYAKEPSKPIFKSHNIISIFNLYPYHVLLELYKVLKFRIPYCIYELFSVQFSRRTENGISIKVPKTRILIEKATFRYQAILLWNLLYKSLLTPVNIDLHKSCKIKGEWGSISTTSFDYSTSVSTFKSRLKKLILTTQHSPASLECWSNNDTLLLAT